MGLLDSRSCPHGHGFMRKQEGLFGLPQMVPASAGLGGLLEDHRQAARGELLSTGKMFTVELFVCPTCGVVEMLDAAKE